MAGTAPASRTRRSDSSPTATPSPGGKPCATSVVSSATTGPPEPSACATSSRTSISSFTASLRAARRSARPSRGRARRRRRGSRRRARRPRRSCRRPRAGAAGHSRPSGDDPVRTALEHERRPVERRRARRCSASFANTRSGASAASRVRKTSGPRSRIAAPGREVDAHRRALGARQPRRLERRARDRVAQQAVARHVQVVAALEPAPARAPLPRSSGATPRSDAIVRAPSGLDDRHHDAVPAAGHDRAERPRRRAAPARRPRARPASSSPRLPTNRACAPSSAAHAATFAACPPAHEPRLARPRRRPARAAGRAARHVEEEVAERAERPP